MPYPGLGSSRRTRSHSRHRIASAAAEALEPRALLSAVVVNTSLDVIDPPGSGRVSLRDAVLIADASKTPTSITFDPINFAMPLTITLDGNDLALTGKQPTTITGPAAGVTISGNAQSSILSIAAATTVSLSGLTLTDGTMTRFSGGAISNAGNLTITGSTITRNLTTGLSGPPTGFQGGGIENAAGATLNVVDSTISGNSAPVRGGISNYGTASLTRVTVSGNGASLHNLGVNQEGPGQCGGIYNGGVMTLTECTVSGNSSGSIGGGILNTGKLAVSDSTIAGNTAYQGPYFFLGPSGKGPGDGGGLVNEGSGASVVVTNTIIAGNNGAGTGPDVDGAVTSRGFNLIGITDGSSGWTSSDLTGTAAHPLDPLLEPLGRFGGPTQTMLPLPASPAIGHGSAALVPAGVTIDQRGLPRVVGGRVDIGAVETGSNQAVLKLTPPANQTAVEGAPKSLSLGKVAATNAIGALTVDVNWGDGSPHSIFSLAAAGAISATSHAFPEEGTYTASVFVIDNSGAASNTSSFSVTTTDATLVPATTTFAVAPGVPIFPSVATFTDPNPNAPTDYRASIAWGDGATSAGTITLAGATYSVSGSHTYSRLGAYTATVRVSDIGGSSFTLHDNVTVAPLDAHRIVVNSTDPGTDPADSSTITLSDAIAIANASPVPVTITFDPKVFSSLQTITPYSGADLTNGTTTLIGPASDVVLPGGITVLANATARFSTLSANSISNSGIAILNSCTVAILYNTGAMTATQCTVAADSGAGIDDAGVLTLLGCTVNGNVSVEPAAQLTVGNTIIVGTATVNSGAQLTSLGFNLVGAAGPVSGWKKTDLTGTSSQPLDPKLAPLGRYGGPTDTMPPLPGSPAIDHGGNAIVPAGISTDQRGASRIVNGVVDIGSVEAQPPVLKYSAPAAQSAIEGQSASILLGSVAETPARGPIACVVNWGDNTPVTTLTTSAAGALPAASHAFAQMGDYNVTVTLFDHADSFVIGSPFAVAVAAAPLSGSTRPVTFAARVPFDRVLATFVQPNPLGVLYQSFAVSVDWGDGTTSQANYSGDASPFTVDASHTYKAAGTYKFIVAVMDTRNGGGTLTLSNEAIVNRARPTTIVVNSTLGSTDPVGSSAVTLPDAVAWADAGPNPTTIRFDPFVFVGHQTIVLGSALNVTTEAGATIVGPKGGVTIQGQSLTNVGGSNLKLSNVTISGGSGINNFGTLRAANLTITGNSASPYGGGITNYDSATLTLTGSTVSNNRAGADFGFGGGIDNHGTMTLLGDTISGNVANASGGGIVNGPGAMMTAINCTIAGNTVTGAIQIGGPGESSDGGGGIANDGAATLSDCTITGNAAAGLGGGVYSELFTFIGATPVTTTLTNTIIAGNSATGPDAAGSVISRGFNLISQTDGSSGWRKTDRTGTAARPLPARLGPLANNGGATLTELPLPGSPAINCGSNARIPPGIDTDQRGRPRIDHGTVDIGSVEV